MRKTTRHSMPVRITALGFIFSILFGNLWLVYLLVGGTLPHWIGYGFYLGVVMALGGGVSTVIRSFFAKAPELAAGESEE